MTAARLRPRLAVSGFIAAVIALTLALPAAASAAEVPLNFVFFGTGEGEVECEVEGGGPEVCEAEYEEGKEVTVLPVAELGSEFVEFFGDCGPLDCELTMDEAHTVNVVFDLEPAEEFALNIEEPGGGSGEVECEVEATTGPCEELYPAGTEVTLIATESLGSEFVEWSGECDSVLGNECEVEMTEEKTVEVVFELEPEEFALNIEEPGSGTGEVKCELEEGPEACALEYPAGTEINLIATAAIGSEFVEWTGCDTVSGVEENECQVEMTEEKTVEVVFNLEGGPPPPTVTEVTPNKGTTAGGTAVTIKGTNLTGATEVKYGAAAVTCTGVVATCKVESATEIKATTPAHAAGTVDVRVVTPGGESAVNAPADQFTFETPVSPPTVTEVTPNKGTTAGGTAVTIKGTNLTGATEVKYGAAAVTCTGVVATCKVESATEIKATTPAHAAGTVDVRVVTPGGESAVNAPADQFTFETPVSPPTVTEVTPNKGTTAGGTAVTIKGTNLTGATEVKYGAAAVTCTGVVATCKVESATEIKATTPAHAAGTVDVRVVTPGGESAVNAPADQFTFETPVSPPTVTEVTPNKGTTAGGTAVTIKGTNLTGATEVKYGAAAVTCTGVVATCKVESATEIKATTPAHAAGTVDVRVVTPGGESAVNAPADQFTFETPVVKHTLTVSKSGSGSGTVVSSPIGIECGSTCSHEYTAGTEVELSQSAASGSEFKEWTGACTGSGACKVTMSAAKAVGAVFNTKPTEEHKTEEKHDTTTPPPPPPPAVGTASAAGTATVTGGKAALKVTCAGGPCSGSFTLTAKIKQGKKTKTLTIGKASFSLAAGASSTLSVKLSGPAKQELAKGKTVKAKLSGSDIAAATVKLKPAKKKKKKK